MVISPKIISLEADSFKDGKMKSLNIVAGGNALFHFWLLDNLDSLFKIQISSIIEWNSKLAKLWSEYKHSNEYNNKNEFYKYKILN